MDQDDNGTSPKKRKHATKNKESRTLIIQFVVGVLLVLVGISMLAKIELRCKRSADICTVTQQVSGAHLWTKGSYRLRGWQSVIAIRARDSDNDFTYFVTFTRQKKIQRIAGFHDKDRDIARRYAKKIRAYIQSKSETLVVREEFDLLRFIFTLMWIGSGIWFIQASLRGVVLEE